MSRNYSDSQYQSNSVPPVGPSGSYGGPMTNPVETEDVRRSVLQAYLWMFAGLLLTAGVSFLFYATGMIETLANYPVATIVLFVVQIGLAIGFAAAMSKASVAVLAGMFLAYAFTMGISLSSICYVYTESTIFAAFLISSVYFGCLALIGYTTKMDMSKIGSVCLVGLLALVISQLVMMLFGTSWSVRLYSIIGLLLFTGLTIWDVQRLNKTMLYSQGEPVAQKKWALYFALQLYLDFINIFLFILQLLGSGSGSKK